MPLVEPIASQLVEDVIETLRTVRIANGYFTELGQKVEELWDPDHRRSGTGSSGAIVIFERESQVDAQQSAFATLELTVLAWHAFSRTDAAAPTAALLARRLAADIGKALKLDYTRTGLAVDTVPVSWSPEGDENDAAMVLIRYEWRIRYLMSYGDATEPVEESTGDIA